MEQWQFVILSNGPWISQATSPQRQLACATSQVYQAPAVAYDGNTFDDSPELVADVTSVYSEDDMQMGWWGKNGRWLLGGLIAVGMVMGAQGDD